MRGIIILALILSVMVLAPVMADIPVEGVTQYSYQYHINNTADYPDYVFLTSSEIWRFEHPSLIMNGTFGGGYKLDGFVLHAIKDTVLDPAIKEQLSTAQMGEKNFTAYFDSAPFASSDILLPISVGMNSTLPINNITVLLNVNGISGNELNVTKVRTLIGFENGTVQEEINNETEENTLSGEQDLELLHMV